jgi:DNA-binding Lrp family transcriptional regulator
VEAYILINTNKGKLWKVATELRKNRYVKRVHVVTGQYDVIAFIEFDTMETLSRVINNVHSIEDVTKTQTAVAMIARTIE